MKYVMLYRPTTNERRPIMGLGWQHADLIFGMNKLGWHAISAGYVRIVDGMVETYGESISLELYPASDDAHFITGLLSFSESVTTPERGSCSPFPQHQPASVSKNV